MLIRSQNKKIIVNMDNVNGFRLETHDAFIEVRIFIDKGFTDVGAYSSTEKAMKVLDMICEEYINGTCVFYDREQIIQHVLPMNTVFQMPTEEEVDKPTITAEDIVNDIMKM